MDNVNSFPVFVSKASALTFEPSKSKWVIYSVKTLGRSTTNTDETCH